MPLILRIRSNVGVWRVEISDPATSTMEDILKKIHETRPHVALTKQFARDPACDHPYENSLSLAKFENGAMIHCRVDPATCAEGTGSDSTQTRRVIGKDGSIQVVQGASESTNNKHGFRKGMMALRDMKMAWTLDEFIAMDSQFVFKMKRQESSFAIGCSLEMESAQDFTSYMQQFQFARTRMAFLYGRYEDDPEDPKSKRKKVIVEAIYEPPQEVDPESAEGFVLLDDDEETQEMQEKVDQLAALCQLHKVGWIIGHPSREEVLTSSEIIMAAEYQLEDAGGVEDTPFCTVTATLKDGQISVEAYQVSKQCMEMVAEQALEVDPANPSICVVNETYTAIQEGKESKTVETAFFVTPVPILQHSSDRFVSQFPKLNRDLDERTPSHQEMKRQLQKSGTAGWTFTDLLSDFNLLVYLTKFLEMSDMAKICESVVERSKPIDDGYKLIIASMAGIDSAY